MARPTPDLDRLREAARAIAELRKTAIRFLATRSPYPEAIQRVARAELDREWRIRRDAFIAELDRLDIPRDYRIILDQLLVRSARDPWANPRDEADVIGLLEHNFLGMTPHAFATVGHAAIRREIRLRMFRSHGHSPLPPTWDA